MWGMGLPMKMPKRLVIILNKPETMKDHNEFLSEIRDLSSNLGLSFEEVSDAFRKAVPPMKNLADEIRLLNWELNLRPKEIKNLKIKSITMGLTYNERKRLKGLI